MTGDESVDRVYDLLGDAYRFLWEVLGHDSFDGRGARLLATIWFDALSSHDLPPDVSFAAFAGITLDAAGTRYGPDSAEVRAVRQSWADVGINPDSAG